MEEPTKITETFVRKLKDEALRRARESGKPAAWHRDELSREAGFQDGFRGVRQALEKWRQVERETGKSRFNKLESPLRAISQFLGAVYPKELSVAFDRYSSLIGRDLPWPDDNDRGIESALLSYGLFEFLVSEGSFAIGGREVRIGEVVLNEMQGLTDVQRHYIRELLSSRLGIYMVSRVVDAQTVVVVDVVDPTAREISVTFPSRRGRNYQGMVAGMRVLQPTTFPYCDDHVMPFLPQALGRVIAEFGKANRDSADQGAGSVSIAVLREFILDSFGPPRFGNVSGPTGKPLVFVTHHYRVIDLRGAIDSISRADGVVRLGGLRFDYRANRSEEFPAIGELVIDATSIYAKMTSLSDDDAQQAKAWLESVVGKGLAFLHTNRQTPEEMVASTSPEEIDAMMARSRVEIPPETQSEVYEDFLHDFYKNWADEPLGAFGGLSPREMCKQRGGVERVRAMLEMYESGERVMAERMQRPAVSYGFLWKQIGLER
jgi:hypothetical protein